MNLDNYLKDIKQVALKNRVWYMGTIIAAVILMLTVMIFWKPKVTIDPEKLNLYHKENVALEYQNRSLKDLVIAQQKSLELTRKGDSAIVKEVVYNRAEVLYNRDLFLKSLKAKPHENIIIDGYNTNDLARECAEIERLYSSSK